MANKATLLFNFEVHVQLEWELFILSFFWTELVSSEQRERFFWTQSSAEKNIFSSCLQVYRCTVVRTAPAGRDDRDILYSSFFWTQSSAEKKYFFKLYSSLPYGRTAPRPGRPFFKMSLPYDRKIRFFFALKYFQILFFFGLWKYFLKVFKANKKTYFTVVALLQ